VSVPQTAEPRFIKGQVWRSSKTWWRVRAAYEGAVIVEGPRGHGRSSCDGGATWSDPIAVMTMDGFAAWVRKTGAINYAE
jgi:hypothetical protein